jgi:hypothetical protein
MFKRFWMRLFNGKTEYRKGYDNALIRISEVGVLQAEEEYEKSHWFTSYDDGYGRAIHDYKFCMDKVLTGRPDKEGA